MNLQYNKLSIPELSKIVHLLGEVLGLVIKKHEGKQYYDKVEKIRLLSKSSRGNKNYQEIKKNFNKLKLNISKLNAKESLIIARSFSQFLNFANLAESLYSVYKLNENKIKNPGVTQEFIILEEIINNLIKNKSISKNSFFNIAKKLKINLVLTAHPTEVKRRTVIQKYAKINNIIEDFNSNKNNSSIKYLKQNLYQEMTSIWKTDEIKRSRPTPVEEAKWGLAVIEDSLWSAVPKICSRFDDIIFQFTGKKLPINYSPITFGSWMGGDRDGNPFVTAKTTEEVVLLSRWMAANLYEKELTKLIQDLSMHECSNTILRKVKGSSEPYRVYLRPIRNKMKTTQKAIELYLNEKKPLDQNALVQSINEVILPLNVVYNSLCSIKCDVVANGSVLNLLRRAFAFGLNLAKIDIRQESSRHTKLLNSICNINGYKNYDSWSETKKISFISSKFKSKKKLIQKNIKLDNEDNEVWSTFKMIAKLPRECLGGYVVSMASNVSDILSVMLLQKEAGIKDYLSVVPLFETLSDLQNSHNTINNLYKVKWYLKGLNKNQEVMIGYSDSGKDAGKFAASWAQYCAQEKLKNVSKKFGIILTLFHGRGGSVGRGGGPVYAALLSQPPGTVSGSTRVTEQGEVIQQKFSTESLAEYSLGTYIGSVLEATLAPPIKPKKEWVKLMDKMSEIANNSYRKYLMEDQNFLKYYKTITPQKIIGQLFISSRPVKRKKSNDIKNLRAIPWVFAWTQIRFILPAWLGTLEAFEYAENKKNIKVLKEMLNKWPFFYEMMDMLDMVLTKTDQRVIINYEEHLADKVLKNTGKKLREQLTKLIYLNKKLISKNILNQRKGYRESVKIRNTYAETLNLIQADIMKKINNENFNKKQKNDLMDAMMVTIAGIAAAMKNTG